MTTLSALRVWSMASPTSIRPSSTRADAELVSDGQLPHPGNEAILETYYSFPWFASKITLDYQLIVNPAYNRDRGPASVFGVRGAYAILGICQYGARQMALQDLRIAGRRAPTFGEPCGAHSRCLSFKLMVPRFLAPRPRFDLRRSHARAVPMTSRYCGRIIPLNSAFATAKTRSMGGHRVMTV